MIRAFYRRVVPQSLRRAANTIVRELPVRVVDAIPDLRDRFSSDALPPASLRAGVGIDSSRSHYVAVGRRVADDILTILGAHGIPAEGRWLDFGCGSGRIARHIASIEHIALTGIDVDRRAIVWCAEHLRGDYRVIDANPPLPFAAGAFDVVYAVSVFTHLDEGPQRVWLAELHRILRPGGALVASTHPPELVYNRPDLDRSGHEQLANNGFAFIRGASGFNDDSAFHRADYVERVWGQYFRIVEHRPGAFFGYQDATICIS